MNESLALATAFYLLDIPKDKKIECGLINEAYKATGSYDINSIRRYFEDIIMAGKMQGKDWNLLNEKTSMMSGNGMVDAMQKLIECDNDYLTELLKNHEKKIMPKMKELMGHNTEYAASLIKRKFENDAKKS